MEAVDMKEGFGHEAYQPFLLLDMFVDMLLNCVGT